MRRKRVIYTPVPEETFCRRCSQTFTYGHTTKPRLYCDPCVEAKRLEAREEYNRFVSENRRKARQAALEAHMAASRSS